MPPPCFSLTLPKVQIPYETPNPSGQMTAQSNSNTKHHQTQPRVPPGLPGASLDPPVLAARALPGAAPRGARALPGSLPRSVASAVRVVFFFSRLPRPFLRGRFCGGTLKCSCGIFRLERSMCLWASDPAGLLEDPASGTLSDIQSTQPNDFSSHTVIRNDLDFFRL